MAHWDVMAATDFFTVEVWTSKGLVIYYVLFIIRLSTRKVYIAGVTPTPSGQNTRLIRYTDSSFEFSPRLGFVATSN